MYTTLFKLLTLLASITILVSCSESDKSSYVSPRAARLALNRDPEIKPGVDYTPNVKPSDFLSRLSTIEPEQPTTPTLQMVLTKGDDGTLIVESTGTKPVYSKDSLFYYPLIPPTPSGVSNYCTEDMKLIENLEQALIFEVEPIITSLPETEAKRVYEEVLSYLKSLCKSQFRKLNALKESVSGLDDSQITEELVIKAFTYAKENDILVTTVYMLAAHSTPFPIPGKSPEVPKTHEELVSYVKEQCSLVKAQGDFMEQNVGRIDKIAVLYQRQHAQRTYLKLSEDVRSELEVCKTVYEELQATNAVSEDVYNRVSDQAPRIDLINAGTLSLAYHLDKYSPVLPSWARDQTKDPFIVGTPEGYGVVMLESSKELEDYYNNVVLKRAEEGDKDAERALLVQRIAVSVLEHRERTTTHAASKFFTILECRAINSLSKTTTIVDPNADFSTNEVESDVEETAGPTSPVRRLAEAASELIDEEDDEEIPDIEEAVEINETEQCMEDPEVVLESLAQGKLDYEPAQCTSLVCLAGPSCIKNRDGSPQICYRPACVNKDCSHVAIHSVDCSEATCEHGNCRPGSCVGGKCDVGRCVGGKFQSGSCSSTKCVGCTTELPRVEGCDVRAPRCEEGACTPSRVRGAKCVKKEILEDYHCARGECKRQDCETCGSSGSGAAGGSDECVAPTCVPGSCTTGSCHSGSCIPNNRPDDRCVHCSCTGGYCIGPKCSANEYDGFKCKAPNCTPPRCNSSCTDCACTPASCTTCGCVPPKCVGGSCGRIGCCGCAPMRCRGVKIVPARIVGRDGRAVGSCQNSSCTGSKCCTSSDVSGPTGSSGSYYPTISVTSTTTRATIRPITTTTTVGVSTVRPTTTTTRVTIITRPTTTTTTTSTTTTTTRMTTTTTTTTSTTTTTTRPTTTTTTTRVTTTTTTTRTTTTTTTSTTTTTTTSTTTTTTTRPTTTTTTTRTTTTTTTTRPTTTTTTTRPTTTTTTTRTTTTTTTTRMTTTTTTRVTTTTTTSGTTRAVFLRTSSTSTTTIQTRFGRSLLQVPEQPLHEETKTESRRPESGRPESDKPESNKPESNKPESNKPESRRPESGRPESRKSCTCTCGGGDSSKCAGCVSCRSGNPGCSSSCMLASGCASSCCGGRESKLSPTAAAEEAESKVD